MFWEMYNLLFGSVRGPRGVESVTDFWTVNTLSGTIKLTPTVFILVSHLGFELHSKTLTCIFW